MKKISLICTLILIIASRSFGQTTLQVIHDAADPTLDSVNVYVTIFAPPPVDLLHGFKFRQSFYNDISSLFSLFDTLATTVSISPTDDSTNFVVNKNVTLRKDKNYLAIASGVVNTANFAPNPDGKSIALSIDTLEEAPISAPPTFVNVTAFNGVTDAPAVDVVVPGFGTVIDSLPYGSFQGPLTFPVLDLTLPFKVVAHGDTNNVLGTFLGNLGAYSGQAIVMFAAGFVNPAVNQNGARFGLFLADTADTVIALPEVPNSVNSIGKNINTLHLYPNPVGSLLNYKYSVNALSDISVSIFNNAGTLVYSRHIGNQIPGSYTESLDISHFAAGIYTVKVGDTKNSSTSTFVRK